MQIVRKLIMKELMYKGNNFLIVSLLVKINNHILISA